MTLPTKIEFSRRGLQEDIAFSAVDRQLLSGYEMPPILSNHYTKKAMYQQKILALAERQQPQARDVFDLYLLLGQNANEREGIHMDTLIAAKQNAKTLTYEEFKSQVIAYLLPEYQAQFDSVEIWTGIVQDVVASLD